ncbi:type II toxin-antitoxin system Phd/YefM family antitoxin [Leptolyngbya sp. AN03gr2]
MTLKINLPETPDQLKDLIQQIQAGEEILLSQNGIAIARLTPIQPRVPGQDKGKIWVSPEFNEPLPDDILNDFLDPQ